MEKKKLLQAIDKNPNIADVNFRELREMLSDFPYFQTGYLLLAQQAALHPADVNMPQIVAKCSTYVGNREQLHKLVTQAAQGNIQTAAAAIAPVPQENLLTTTPPLPPEEAALNEVTTETNPIPAETETPEPEPALPENTPAAEEETIAFDLSASLKRSAFLVPDEPEVVLPEPINLLLPDEESLPDEEDNWVEMVKNTPDYTDLETEEITLDTHAIAEEARKQVELELQRSLTNTDTDAEQPETIWQEQPDLTESIENEALQLIQHDIDLLAEEGVIDEQAQQKIDDSVKEDTDLMANLKKRLEEYRNKKQEPTGFDQWITTPNPEQDANIDNPEQTTEQQNDNDNNQEPPPPDSFAYLPPEKSVFNLNDSLVTETMARIYVRQENFDKAKAIYEQLITKYPEKSAYFAAKIEELNNKLT